MSNTLIHHSLVPNADLKRLRKIEAAANAVFEKSKEHGYWPVTKYDHFGDNFQGMYKLFEILAAPEKGKV